MVGDRRVGSIELPTLGHRQKPGVEAGGVPDREKLLWIGAGSALAAQFFWDGQLDGEPAVRGPAVTCSPSFDHGLGCVQDVHICSLTWKTTRTSVAQATVDVASVEVCTSLECAQFGQCWHSGHLAVQRCEHPLCIVLFEMELMCCRRGEDLEEHELVWIILSSGLV